MEGSPGKYFTTEVKSLYTGRNDSGVVLGEEEESVARSFSGEETPQFLRHLSTFFWIYASQILVKGDAEVEAMYVNERLVVSANNTGTMKTLYDHMLKEQSVLDVFRSHQDIDDLRGMRTVNRFQNEVMSPDINSDPLAVLQELGSQEVSEAVILRTIRRKGKAGVVLVDEDCRGKLILVNGLNAHAEQKLLLMLLQSGLPLAEQVYIRGKKRPCFGCWLCLHFVRDVLDYSNIDFNDHPGLAWIGAINELKTFIATIPKVDKQSKKKFVKWAKEMIDRYKEGEHITYTTHDMVTDSKRTDYDTESDDDVDAYEDMNL